jgi:hypothetical protein
MGERNAPKDVASPPSAEAKPTGERASPEGVLDLQYVFDALSHPRRRYLLSMLHEKRAWTLTELAEKIAAWEHDVEREAVTRTDRDEVYVSLHHAHVPKLVDDRIVEFDRDDETIAKGSNVEKVLAVLEEAGASRDSTKEDHARSERDD